MLERTLVLIKPDGVQRSLAGEILHRFERMGLKIVGLKMVRIDPDFSKKHYEAHVGKPFYPALEEFIVSAPVIAIALEGVHAVDVVRKSVGATEPSAALPGTIRGDYAMHSYAYTRSKGICVRNLIHASEDANSADRELNLWFAPEELHSYRLTADRLVL